MTPVVIQTVRRPLPGTVLHPREHRAEPPGAGADGGLNPGASTNSSAESPGPSSRAVLADELSTDLQGIRRAVDRCGGPSSVLCVMSTTSCFAPRGHDDVQGIARLCKEAGIPHLINNAYGLQAGRLTHCINEACRVGRVDAFVSSTDKNFMTPVGGAIVSSPDKGFVERVSTTYPGRASSAPLVDLFATLLSLGKSGYKELLKERKAAFIALKAAMEAWATKHGERVLQTPSNPISIATTLSTILDRAGGDKPATLFGSMLFQRGVSGARVVQPGARKDIAGHVFEHWGSQSAAPEQAYFTVAAGMGLRAAEVPVLVGRLDKAVEAFCARKGRKGGGLEGGVASRGVSQAPQAAGGGGGGRREDERDGLGAGGVADEGLVPAVAIQHDSESEGAAGVSVPGLAQTTAAAGAPSASSGEPSSTEGAGFEVRQGRQQDKPCSGAGRDREERT